MSTFGTGWVGKLVATLAAVAAAGCASDLPPTGSPSVIAAAAAMGTPRDAEVRGHEVLSNQNLAFPGILVAFESGERAKIGGDPAGTLDLSPLGPQARTALEAKLAEGRAMFLSHVVEFRMRGAEEMPERLMHYSAYEPLAQPVTTTYAAGQAALERLGVRVRDLIDERRATHVFVYTPGWFATETAALEALSRWVAAMNESRGPGPDFRPVYIGVGWFAPWRSVGDKRLVSAPNDADVLGLVWVNPLLNRVVVPAARGAASKPKVVVVGHSHGCRAAVYGALGGSLLRGGATSGTVDAVVGLQGAFQIERFIPGAGREGAPYASLMGRVPRVAFTVAASDRFMPTTVAPKMIGQPGGWDEASRHRAIFDRRELLGDRYHAGFDQPLPLANARKVLLVKADPFILSHNDVYSSWVASLIWHLIP